VNRKTLLELLAQSSDLVNPEIWHARNLQHPGYCWYIKTILPKVSICDDSSFFIIKFWLKFAENSPKLIRISPHAYDWYGRYIPNWSTIWLNHEIDINWNFNSLGDVDMSIISYHAGLQKSADTLHFTDDVLNTIHDEDGISHLKEIQNYLKTFSSDDNSKKKRKKIKVLTNE
jgi:hypothetical protein